MNAGVTAFSMTTPNRISKSELWHLFLQRTETKSLSDTKPQEVFASHGDMI